MSSSDFYTEPQRHLQEQFESQPLAQAIESAIVETELDDLHAVFISTRDYFFLSTVNAAGEPTVSHKGGDVGLVKVIDSTTLAFPAYDGNGMFLSLGNISDTAKIGMLFIDFETPHRVRVQATASFSADDELMSEYPGSIGIVRASVDRVFINCARYIHKHTRVATSKYVPDENGEQPFASWKRIEDFQDHLHPDDQGKAEENGGLITEAQYAEALLAGES